MKLSSSSRIIRFAYFFQGWSPETVSLCALFWRCVGTALALLIPMTLAGFYIAMWIVFPWDAFVATTALLTVIIGIAVLTTAGDAFRYISEKAGEKTPTLLSETIYAIKNKVCPIIYID